MAGSSILVGLFLLNISIVQGQNWFPLNQGFESGSIESVYDIEIGPIDQKIYVCGDIFASGDGAPVMGVSRWDSQQGQWSTDYSDSFGYVRDIGFYNGILYANGPLTMQSIDQQGNFHYWDSTNWIFDSLGPSSGVFGSRVIDNLFYIVGGFDEVGGEPTYGIAIYNGETFTPFFGEFADDYHFIEDVIEFQDEIYVIGQSLSGFPDYEWRGMAKLGDDVLEVAHEDFTGNFFQMWPHCLEVYDGELYIGGWFHEGQGFAGNGIVRYDGEEMNDVGGGVNFQVYDMKVYENELYVVGQFGRIGEESIWDNFTAGEHCSGVAKWDGNTWTCLLQQETDFNSFRTLEVFNDTLYVGGPFSSVLGDTLMSMIAALPLDTGTGFSEDVAQLAGLTLYPNPSHGELSLDFGQLLNSDAEIEIYNAIGQQLLAIQLTPGQQTYVLDTPYAAGLYYLQLQLDGERVSKKFIVRD